MTRERKFVPVLGTVNVFSYTAVSSVSSWLTNLNPVLDYIFHQSVIYDVVPIREALETK